MTNDIVVLLVALSVSLVLLTCVTHSYYDQREELKYTYSVLSQTQDEMMRYESGLIECTDELAICEAMK